MAIFSSARAISFSERTVRRGVGGVIVSLAVERYCGRRSGAWLHVDVIGTAATLRCHPVDVLAGILDVAGLAMHAILRVDLQPLAGGAGGIDELVDAGRAIALLGTIVNGEVHFDGDRR